MKPEDFDLLLERQLDGTLDENGQRAFVVVLEQHDWAQQRFVRRMSLGAQLGHRLADEPADRPAAASDLASRGFGRSTRLALVAASLFCAVGIVAWLSAIARHGASPTPAEPAAIATLLSSEGAAWESALPTEVGSPLPPGTMTLKHGLATIRFSSGAEMRFEAPFRVALSSAMRCKVLEGTAVFNVPDSAKGFVLDTPDGYAVDHGTAFSVSVGKADAPSSFEVLDGEISLHVDGETLHLKENEAASMSAGRILRNEEKSTEGTLSAPRGRTRLTTGGKSVSIIQNDDFALLHPDFLMVKNPLEPHQGYRRRAFFAIAIAEQNVAEATQAKLLLNLVPCGLGSALHLPEVNRIEVYGLGPETNIDGTGQPSWRDLPGPEGATLLGTFEVPRSQQRGTFGIEGHALLDFLGKHRGPDATFLLVRETAEDHLGGLVHAFATDSHPEASGPTLELTISKTSKPHP